MKRFFRKKPPPGWEPPLLVKRPPTARETVDAFATFQARLHEQSKTMSKLAAVRRTDSRTWTASPSTDSIPWTAVRPISRDGDTPNR